MSNHSKSISALYYKATGQTLREQDIAEVSKFANVVREAVEKDVRAELARAAPSAANGAEMPELPEPCDTLVPQRIRVWRVDKLRAYGEACARAAVLAERSACIETALNHSFGSAIAAAIRART